MINEPNDIPDEDEDEVLRMMELMEGEVNTEAEAEKAAEADALLSAVIEEMAEYVPEERVVVALVIREGVEPGQVYMALSMLKDEIGIEYIKMSRHEVP